MLSLPVASACALPVKSSTVSKIDKEHHLPCSCFLVPAVGRCPTGWRGADRSRFQLPGSSQFNQRDVLERPEAGYKTADKKSGRLVGLLGRFFSVDVDANGSRPARPGPPGTPGPRPAALPAALAFGGARKSENPLSTFRTCTLQLLLRTEGRHMWQAPGQFLPTVTPVHPFIIPPPIPSTPTLRFLRCMM